MFKYKSQGSATSSVKLIKSRCYPVSCANLSAGPWSTPGDSLGRFGNVKTSGSNTTEGYYRRRARGDWIPWNPFWSTEYSCESVGETHFTVLYLSPTVCTPPITSWCEYQGKYMPVFANSMGGFGALSAVTNEQKLKLSIEVQSGVLKSRASGKANFVESFAELDKAFDMIRNPLVNVNRFLDQFFWSSGYQKLDKLRKSRTNWSLIQSRKLLKKPRPTRPTAEQSFLLILSELWASEWLRYRYGIKPLLEDVKAGLEALRTNYKKAKSTDRHTVRLTRGISGNKVVKFLAQDDGVFKNYATRTYSESYSIKGMWTDEYAANPWTDLGLTFRNVVGVSWELTRYSFVVDWFTNVGDLIYANIPVAGVSPLGGSLFYKEEIVNDLKFTEEINSNPTNYARIGTLSDSIKIKQLRKERGGFGLNSSLTFVTKADFRLDHFTRATDALAITRQLVGKVWF